MQLGYKMDLAKRIAGVGGEASGAAEDDGYFARVFDVNEP